MVIRVHTGEDAGQEVVLAPGRALVLGRQRGCDVVLRDPRASRRHAELRPLAGGRYLLRDLGSANGTWVGGRRVEEAVLGSGVELRLGDVRLGLAAAPASRVSPREPDAADRPPAPPTHSMVGRIVDSRTRRAHRALGAVGALAAVAAAGLAVVLLGESAPAPAGAEGTDRVPGVVARLAPSTVLVESLRGASRTATGSGWVLDAREGLVVTSAHVLQGPAVRIAAGGRRRSARVVAAAPCEDVALLRVADARGLRSAGLGRDASVRQGETVVALGYPQGAGPGDSLASTTGVVSVASTAYEGGGPDVPRYPEAVQTDTALNPGSSGGPLSDLEGRLVGMSAAVRTADASGRTVQNQGYAIAIDRLRAVVAGLRAGRAPAWTGLTLAYPTRSQLAAQRLPAGPVATGAVAGSPAARAGLSGGTPGEALVGIEGRRLNGASLSAYCTAAAAAGDRPRTLAFARAGTGRIRRVSLP